MAASLASSSRGDAKACSRFRHFIVSDSQDNPLLRQRSGGMVGVDGWLTIRGFGAGLLLLLLVAFWPVWLGLESFVTRDYGVLAYPVVAYHHESFWRGEWPLWNPLSNCGAPFLAQWGTMVLYPFSLIYLLLPLPWSLGLFCLGHLFLGGLAMHWLARRWLANEFAASVAGIAFCFNGITLSCLIWPNYLVALGWMPLVVGLAERAWREGGRARVAAALAGALQLLSGVPELILLTWLVIGALWIADLFGREPVGWGGARVWRNAYESFWRLASVVALVSGLTAIQLLPFIDLLEHSQRGLAFATGKWSMPAWGWANQIVPLFRCFKTPQGSFFQVGQEFLSSEYPGLGVLALALLAPVYVRRSRALALAGLALFGFLMAAGDHSPLYLILRSAIPMLGLARYPIKFVLLAAFAIPLLAGFTVAAVGAATTAEKSRLPRRASVLGFGLIVTGGALLWYMRAHPLKYDRWDATVANFIARVALMVAILAAVAAQLRIGNSAVRRALQAGVLALIALDALTHAPRQNPTISADAFVPRLSPLAAEPGHAEARVLISPRAEQILLRSEVTDAKADFLGKRLALWSNLNLLDGIPKVNGSATLQLREQAVIQSLIYATPTTDLPGLADFLAVRHVTSASNAVQWEVRGTARPLITIGQQPVFADAAATLNALTNADFDGAKVVYLPAEAKVDLAGVASAQATVKTLRWSAQCVEAEASSDAPAVLVIAQSFYHPWRAFVDGEPTRLWRANFAFQALAVPAGTHRVRLAYVDVAFRWGAGITSATLLVCGWLAWRSRAGR